MHQVNSGIEEEFKKQTSDDLLLVHHRNFSADFNKLRIRNHYAASLLHLSLLPRSANPQQPPARTS